MKRFLSLCLACAFFYVSAAAYTVSNGAFTIAPSDALRDLNAYLQNAGAEAFVPTGADASRYSASSGDALTFSAQGSGAQSAFLAVELALSDTQAALESAIPFGVACGGLIALSAPTATWDAANAALQLDDLQTEGVRTYYQDKTLFSYTVRADAARLAALPFPSGQTGIALVVNDRFLQLDAAPRLINSRTLVPLRGIFEELGATVEWEAGARTAVVTGQDGAVVRVTIGSTTATVDGQSYTLDAAPVIVSGENRTLVPVRFIAEALGAQVGWSQTPRAVLIASPPQ